MKKDEYLQHFGMYGSMVEQYVALARERFVFNDENGMYHYFGKDLTEILELELSIRNAIESGALKISELEFSELVPEYNMGKTILFKDRFKNKYKKVSNKEEGIIEYYVVDDFVYVTAHEIGSVNTNVPNVHKFELDKNVKKPKIEYITDVTIDKNDYQNNYLHSLPFKEWIEFNQAYRKKRAISNKKPIQIETDESIYEF